MLIICPSCTTAYRLELSTLGAAGRSVRCARCRAVWFASVADLAPAALALSGADASMTAEEPDQRSPSPAHEPADAVVAGPEDAGAAGSFGSSPDAPSDGTAVTIDNAPSLVPAPAPDGGSAPVNAAATGPDIETSAARCARKPNGTVKRRRSARLPGLPAVILVLAAALAALLHWRASVVRILPQTATLFSAVGLPVNLRGLSFDAVKTSVESHEGAMVLVVQGMIANLTRKPLEVPRLRFAVRNGAGYEVYAWTALPTQTALGPGDSVPFRSRLASPPADGQDIIVRFFNRHDVAAGTN
jgi:predicted Zn finger-like uncharacterized protein